MELGWLRMSAVIAPMIPLLREVACWDGLSAEPGVVWQTQRMRADWLHVMDVWVA